MCRRKNNRLTLHYTYFNEGEKMKSIFVLSISVVLLVCRFAFGQQPEAIKHTIVAIEEGQFHGWPANNGVWAWGNEILVGFTQVEYEETEGHNIKEDAPQLSLLARSEDGGQTWQMFDPDKYVGDGGEKTKLDRAINFKREGFAMRVFGTAYHGTDDPEAGFYYSYDKGISWNGPYYLGGIAEHARFNECILTPRTDYIVLNEKECLIFISSRIDDTGMSDDISVINTKDGGLSFDILCPWVVPCSDPYRAVMPSTVQVSKNEFVMAIRRRVIADGHKTWIDCYKSEDGGKNWSFLSKVCDAGRHNGNPPAITKLADGRLCCIYGNRTKKQILGRYSSDNGKTWEEEFVIRDNYYTGETGDMKDLGYPRLVQNKNGELVAIYYWASAEHKQQHIAASIWKP